MATQLQDGVTVDVTRKLLAASGQPSKIPVLAMAEASHAAQATVTNVSLRDLSSDVEHLRDMFVSYEKESAVLMRKLVAPDIVFTGPTAQDDTDPVADMLGGVC